MVYTQEGVIYYGGSTLGTFDADRGEWIPGVDRILARHGIRRVGPWSPDLLGDFVALAEDTPA